MTILFVAIAAGAAALTVATWLMGPRRRQRRMWVHVALRLVAIGAILAALLEPYWQGTRAQVSVVVVVDVSTSATGRSSDVASAALAPYIQALPGDAEAAAIAFGGAPTVVRGFGKPGELLADAFRRPATGLTVDRSGTDIQAALQLAMDLLPPSGDRRILLATDGAETAGDMRDALPRLRAEGIPITVVPLASSAGVGVRVTSLRVPPYARAGAPIMARVVIESDRATTGTLRVSLGSRTTVERHIDISDGVTLVELAITPEPSDVESGEQRIVATLTTTDDPNTQDNRASAYVSVAGQARGLYISGNTEGVSGVEAALLAMDDVAWTRGATDVLPAHAARLAAYDVVVFDNVAASDLTDPHMRALADYVGAGGGWLTVGGPRTYGAGAWQNTALEDASPVEMIPQDRKQPLALLLLLDKSGSMAHESAGVQKLTLAASATRAAIDALDDGDHVGVVAFDAKAHVAAPLTPKDSAASVMDAVEGLRPGAGTDIGAALMAADRLLTAADFPRRHVVLLSDGQSEGDLAAMARGLAEKGITVSTVAVGSDATPVLRAIAEAGGGSFHAMSDMSRLPRVFAEEARQTGDVVVREPTQVAAGRGALAEGAYPPIAAYLATTAKRTAQTFLETTEGDPLLVGWRHGLGKSLAFMSDGGARWTTSWTGEPEFAGRWESWLRWTLPDGRPEAFDFSLDIEGSTVVARLTYPPDSPPAGPFRIRAVSEDGELVEGEMTPVGSGVDGRIALPGAGVYAVTALADEREVARGTIEYAGAAEYLVPPRTDRLRALAEGSGGAVAPEPRGWDQRTGAGVPYDRELAPLLLLLGVAVVFLEWVVRHFGWTRTAGPFERTDTRLSALSLAKRRAGTPERSLTTRPPKHTTARPPSTDGGGSGLDRLRAAKSRARPV